MKDDNIKRRTGAELRAMREQREADRPGAEARRREASFLKNLSGARDDYRWITANEAWLQLGYENYTAWYVARVWPLIEALGARPTPELANDVIERVHIDEAALPATQRRTDAEVAALAGVDRKTVGRRSQDRSGGTLSPGGDLDEVARATAVFDAKYSQDTPGAHPSSSTDLKLSDDETVARPGADSSGPVGSPEQALVAGAGSEVEHPRSGAGETALPAPTGAAVAQPEPGLLGSDELEGGGLNPPRPPSSSDPDGYENPVADWMSSWRWLVHVAAEVGPDLAEEELAEVKDDIATLRRVLFGEA